MKIFVEAKYCLIKSYSSTQVAGGIAYIFWPTCHVQPTLS
jgi:hypothetical protein